MWTRSLASLEISKYIVFFIFNNQRKYYMEVNFFKTKIRRKKRRTLARALCTWASIQPHSPTHPDDLRTHFLSTSPPNFPHTKKGEFAILLDEFFFKRVFLRRAFVKS